MNKEKIIGKMSLMDDKYYWCSYAQQVITLVINQWDLVILLVDNKIHVTNNICEFEGRCFNTECKYNKDKSLSYVIDNTENEIDWDEHKVQNVKKCFNDMNTTLHESSELIEMLNNGGIVRSGYEWYTKE